MLMPTVGTGRPADGGPGQRRRLPRAAWLALGPLAGLAGQLIVAHFDPAIEMITTICGIGVPTALAVVLFFVALFGSDSQEERAYRLMRLLRDKPEPPGPPKSLPQPPRSPKVAKRSCRSRGRRPRRKR
jgi:hypothetical protein